MLFFSSLILLFSAFFGSFTAQTLEEDAVSVPTVSDESTLLIDTPEPGTSSLNFTPGRIAANAVAVKLGGGSVCISTYAAVHLVADVAGLFTGPNDFVAANLLF